MILDLTDSNIAEIENLGNLRRLEILNLGKPYEMGDNYITEIKGLENLSNLKELRLGHNRI